MPVTLSGPRLGDVLEVAVARVDLERRELDFRLAGRKPLSRPKARTDRLPTPSIAAKAPAAARRRAPPNGRASRSGEASKSQACQNANPPATKSIAETIVCAMYRRLPVRRRVHPPATVPISAETKSTWGQRTNAVGSSRWQPSARQLSSGHTHNQYWRNRRDSIRLCRRYAASL